MNSWKAKEMLGLPHDQAIEPLAPEELADRFFLGEVETLLALKKIYTG